MIRQNWFDVKGDETLALDWPLTEDSHVWEIGGFEGRWAQQIWDKFHCNIRIFEPQDWAVQKLRDRFKELDKVEIRPYGLWIENKSLPIGKFFTDGATMIPSLIEEPVANGVFKDNYHEILNFGNEIDLTLMNIEGAEYHLIPNFIASGVITRFRKFWCQFHPFEDNDKRHIDIFDRMTETHDLLWDCFPHAVAWRRK